MKQISILLLSILLITSVTAYTVYSGEPVIIQLEEQFAYYSVVGNSTEVILNVTQDENNNVTIIPDKYMSNDTFEIIFFNPEKETITVYQSSGGGGGGGTKTVYRDNITLVPFDNYIAVDKEIEVEKEIEVFTEKVVIPWWIYGIIIVLIIVSLYSYLRSDNTDVRRYGKYE